MMGAIAPNPEIGKEQHWEALCGWYCNTANWNCCKLPCGKYAYFTEWACWEGGSGCDPSKFLGVQGDATVRLTSGTKNNIAGIYIDTHCSGYYFTFIGSGGLRGCAGSTTMRAYAGCGAACNCDDKVIFWTDAYVKCMIFDVCRDLQIGCRCGTICAGPYCNPGYPCCPSGPTGRNPVVTWCNVTHLSRQQDIDIRSGCFTAYNSTFDVQRECFHMDYSSASVTFNATCIRVSEGFHITPLPGATKIFTLENGSEMLGGYNYCAIVVSPKHLRPVFERKYFRSARQRSYMKSLGNTDASSIKCHASTTVVHMETFSLNVKRGVVSSKTAATNINILLPR